MGPGRIAMVIERFEVYLVNLDPTQGREIQKTRPCFVISPNEINHHIGTIIIVLITTRDRDYPTRVPVTFQGKDGQIVLDQIRTVDKTRLFRRLGQINESMAQKVLEVLAEIFAP